MASYERLSPSPGVGLVARTTPLHSPQHSLHSLHSSTSSRAPLRQLTIHEYRKQQNSPVPRSATPTGKTLRRRPATPALNEVERTPSTSKTQTPVSKTRPLPIPPRPSNSAHQLVYQPFPPSPPLLSEHNGSSAQPLRCQSAEPYRQGGAVSREISLHPAAEKVRNFKPIKRLPRPSATSGSGKPSPTPSPTHSPPAVTPPPQLSTRRSVALAISIPTDSQTTPSTVSFSHFPQPPHFGNPISSPNNGNALPGVTSFTTTAPATPPATPAVIHYRGASFDLVNPRDSLILHNIVTPSRDFDSSEFLPLRSSGEISVQEMSHKRPLYSDLNTAYSSITRREIDAANAAAAAAGLPLPPLPAAQTPTSSSYNDSVLHSPESPFLVAPLQIKKQPQPSESRFSLKNLTRTLTRKLAKTSETANEEELQNLEESRASLATASFNGNFPRPLERTYQVHDRMSSYQDDPSSPVSPMSPIEPFSATQTPYDQDLQSPYDVYSYGSAPLTSMIPDEHVKHHPQVSQPPTPFAMQRCSTTPSISGVGDFENALEQALDQQTSRSEGHLSSRPYYEDMASIYSSSSVYTGDAKRQSKRPASMMTEKMSNNPYARMSGNIDAIANEYKEGLRHTYSDSRRTSRRVSRPLEQEMFHRSMQQQDGKTDTISKIIDRYKSGEGSVSSRPTTKEEISTTRLPATEERSISQASMRVLNGGYVEESTDHSIEAKRGNRPVSERNSTIYNFGPPPGPLASPFEYDDILQNPYGLSTSELYSKASSYGDTGQLLQLSQPMVESSYYGKALEPSSSYSQAEAPQSPTTPQEALKQAEEIFGQTPQVSLERKDEIVASRPQKQQGDSRGIPTIWSGRGSGSRLPSRAQLINDTAEIRQKEDTGSDGGDWETVGDISHRPNHMSIEESFAKQGRMDELDAIYSDRHVSLGESIANYSSDNNSRGSRDSMGFSGNLAPYEEPPLQPGEFQFRYQNFPSSPPQLGARITPTPLAASPRPFMPSSPPFPTTAPALVGRPGLNTYTGPPIPPDVDVLGLSDKTTQELLASGPNEEIMYHSDNEEQGHTDDSPTSSGIFSIGRSARNESQALHAGNKQPLPGTGTNVAGTTLADNNGPGALGSSPYERGISATTLRHGSARRPCFRNRIPNHILPEASSMKSDKSSKPTGFYRSPGRQTSVSRVPPETNPFVGLDGHDRSPSQCTLFPRLIPNSPSPQNTGRRTSAESYRSRSERRGSRSAVRGQTKLRQMVLNMDNVTLASTTRTMRSGRPSSANTNTPLVPVVSQTKGPRADTYEHSPHLLCPERAVDPVEEARRRKLSWIIFAIFCLLPPIIILYRWMGDFVIVNVTQGKITHADARVKKIALVGGVAINMSISGAILLPILIAHSTGAL